MKEINSYKTNYESAEPPSNHHNPEQAKDIRKMCHINILGQGTKQLTKIFKDM
jgi:hypothetical protein